MEIAYGYPLPETMEMANRGEIALGGCCVSDSDPRKHCKACGEDFDLPPRAPKKRRRFESVGV